MPTANWGIPLGPPGAPAPPPNPSFSNPFSSDSMWNTPVSTYINAGAYYGRAGDGGAGTKPGFAAIPTSGGQGIYCDIVYIYDSAAAGTANMELYYGSGWPAQAPSGPGSGMTDSGRVVKLPSGLYVPSYGNGNNGVSDANAVFGYLDEGSGNWWQGEAFCCDNNGGGGNTTPSIGINKNNDGNCADVANTKRGNLGGRGGSGLSSVGGVLRQGELGSVTGYPPHAGSVTFPMGLYGRQDVPSPVPANATNYGWTGTSGIGTGGFAWPAVTQDSGYNSGGAGQGNNYGGAANGTPWVWMGSLLAIRPQDLSGVLAGLPNGTQAGKNTANQWCTYGVYITDNAAQAATFAVLAVQVDQQQASNCGLKGTTGAENTAVQADINYVFQQLYVVLKANQTAPN